MPCGEECVARKTARLSRSGVRWCQGTEGAFEKIPNPVQEALKGCCVSSDKRQGKVSVAMGTADAKAPRRGGLAMDSRKRKKFV